MINSLFLQISFIILIVLGVSIVMRILRQPLIIGYILSGILIGPFLFDALPDPGLLSTFSEFGIAFLLFIVGLHLSPKVIKDVGKISLITGIGQVLFTSLIGYFLALWLGFSRIEAIYISIALTFSSTIIIMKLLSDKDALEKLYGKISIGFLLVQDLIAILILLIVSSFSNGGSFSSVFGTILLKSFLIFIILIPFSYFILPKFSSFFAKSQELLFLFAIAWGLGLSSLFFYIGFSIEVGALIAGVLLSMSPYNYEVSSKLRPLRDFFIISFFILLGSQMVFGDISKIITPAIVLSLFILVGNPIIVMILMGFFGYSKITGFMAGLTVAQISEFSLILIALGVRIGHLSNEVLSLVTIVGLFTIAGSTYMIMYAEKIYSKIHRHLSFFERKKIKEDSVEFKEYDYILFGENRIGFPIMEQFIKSNKKYVIVDFNPARVKKLTAKRVHCIFGDVSNVEFLDNLHLDKSKLIVSTVSEKEVSLLLIERIRDRNKNAVIIVTASQASDALTLYKAGADYVILPQFLGGEYTSNLIQQFKLNKQLYKKESKKQVDRLKKRLDMK